ncbi:hypothetical protein ACFLR8_00330 [Bacteroidota bacterium]
MKPHESISYLLFLFLGIQFSTGSITASYMNPDEPGPLFETNEPLSLTLTMDIREVIGDTDDEQNQYPAEISYGSPGGDTIVVPLQIRTRGHFRKNPINCDFPPLRLNFSTVSAKNSIFEGQDKLKLVTHCRSRGTQYEQNVLDEYLAYRLYNLFTEESYRVRLVELTYADSDGKKDTLRKMAILIESAEQMALRNKSNYIEVKNVQQNKCDRQKTSVLSVFQYMIGNTDWSVPVPHNIDLLQKQPGIDPVAVPYDFDWCGMVDAPYAFPAENLGIDNVRTRLFRGYCRTNDEFELVFQEFRDKKDEIFNTIESVPHLNDRELEKVKKYIGQFYKILDNPKSVKNEFYNKCRTD